MRVAEDGTSIQADEESQKVQYISSYGTGNFKSGSSSSLMGIIEESFEKIPVRNLKINSIVLNFSPELELNPLLRTIYSEENTKLRRSIEL